MIAYIAEYRYLIETLWWMFVLAVAGKIVNLMLNRPPRRKEKP